MDGKTTELGGADLVGLDTARCPMAEASTPSWVALIVIPVEAEFDYTVIVK